MKLLKNHDIAIKAARKIWETSDGYAIHIAKNSMGVVCDIDRGKGLAHVVMDGMEVMLHIEDLKIITSTKIVFEYEDAE